MTYQIDRSPSAAEKWRLRQVGRYALAVASTLLAAGVHWALPDVLMPAPFLAFYPAVVVAAAVGGMGPGIVATVGSALCVSLVFHPMPGWTSLSDPIVLTQLGIFLAGGIGVSIVAGRMRLAQAVEHERAGEMRLRDAALEAAANGIALTDARGTILWANPAFCGMTGYSRDEILGQNPRILKSGLQDAAFYRNMWETIRRGEVWHGELANRRKDGTIYTEEMTISPVRDEKGRIGHFIAVKQDVTARKQAEQELAAAKASVEAASAAKDQFLAVLSHELRTPLTPVLVAVSMLQNDEHLDLDTRESLELIRRNAELEARLIDDLLDITRIARGKIELVRDTVDLTKVLRRAIEVCQPDIEARGLHFGVEVVDGPVWIDADAGRLQQVFWNLLKNAIKFTPHKGCVGIRCRRTSDDPSRPAVIVEVHDSGMGIDPAVLPRLFNAFEQAERSITRQFGGLGLGLAISKALVELHGGQISAHSEGKGKGASFRVRLPLHVGAGHAPPSPDVGARHASPSPDDGAGHALPLRILLVEDHGDTAQMLRRLLVSEGHTVTRAGDLATALELASQLSFDLIISDLGLPDGSGHDLLRQLRSRGQTPPAIALSGYGQEQDIARSMQAGFATHLTKPTSLDRLTEAIATVSAAPVAH